MWRDADPVAKEKAKVPAFRDGYGRCLSQPIEAGTEEERSKKKQGRFSSTHVCGSESFP
jgi:hypothetical protein